MNPRSFRETVFVVEELGMIQIGTLDVTGSALGDGPDVGGENDGLSRTVGFRAFDIEAQAVSIFLYQASTILNHTCFPNRFSCRIGLLACHFSDHTGMGENDKIVTRYRDDPEFQNAAFPILAKAIFETVRGKEPVPPVQPGH
jgi:hypothetical protein